MINFISGCVRLFSMTFSAACELEFFRFLSGTLILGCCYGLFLLLHRGVKKM